MPRLWLPPKVWLQGSQSTRTGCRVSQERPDVGDHSLVGREHAMGVQDTLRVPGRPRREEDLRDGVGAYLAVGRFQLGTGRRGPQRREQLGAVAFTGAHERRHVRNRVEGGLVPLRRLDVHGARLEQFGDRPDAGVVAALQ